MKEARNAAQATQRSAQAARRSAPAETGEPVVPIPTNPKPPGLRARYKTPCKVCGRWGHFWCKQGPREAEVPAATEAQAELTAPPAEMPANINAIITLGDESEDYWVGVKLAELGSSHGRQLKVLWYQRN